MSLLKESLQLYNSLCEPFSKDIVFSECVSSRLENLFTLQTRTFDECLDNAYKLISEDLSDVHKLSKVKYSMDKLYRAINTNRVQLLQILVDVDSSNKLM